jgi:polyhydroxyalkanoate synthesis regulator phasin
MAGPADDELRGARDLAGDFLYAGVGAVALTRERAEELVEELSSRGRMSREDARGMLDDLTGRWRGEAGRMGERASSGLSGVMRELGLVTRREWEELELRLAQLEHRLRLVEGEPKPPAPPL